MWLLSQIVRSLSSRLRDRLGKLLSKVQSLRSKRNLLRLSVDRTLRWYRRWVDGSCSDFNDGKTSREICVRDEPLQSEQEKEVQVRCPLTTSNPSARTLSCLHGNPNIHHEWLLLRSHHSDLDERNRTSTEHYLSLESIRGRDSVSLTAATSIWGRSSDRCSNETVAWCQKQIIINLCTN